MPACAEFLVDSSYLSQWKIESGKRKINNFPLSVAVGCIAMHHSQNFLGEVLTRMEDATVMADWLRHRIDCAYDMLSLAIPHQVRDDEKTTPLLESVAHFVRKASIFPNWGRNTNCERSEQNNFQFTISHFPFSIQGG